ncbi:NUDIX hydrolase domain [Sesbania bispinosa]|nr:NUDIX hydrolase domain [Sesbania bispinosa]
MELKSFSSNSVSTFEVAHVGRSSSTLLSSFKHKVGVRFSTQFKCRRGLYLRTYSASDETYLADKAVISSVGSDNHAVETSSHHINGINGSSSSFYHRNLRVLDAFDDDYGGVVIDPNRIPANPYAFAPVLRLSLSQWKKMNGSSHVRSQHDKGIILHMKNLTFELSDDLQGKKGIWLKLPLEKSDLVPIAVKEGFQYHHAEPGYVMLTYWIPEGPCMLPANASHQVGVGGFVINDNNEVLVVQEKHCSPGTSGLWKIPTGFIHEAEEIYTGVVREVKEETGIETEFIEVIAFRHAHHLAFEKSDLFFICMLRPLSSKIIVDDLEVEAAKWMPLVEFVEQPLIQEDSMFKKIIDIFVARLGKRYCGLSTHQIVSKFDGRTSSLYYNVIDNQDINCVGN